MTQAQRQEELDRLIAAHGGKTAEPLVGTPTDIDDLIAAHGGAVAPGGGRLLAGAGRRPGSYLPELVGGALGGIAGSMAGTAIPGAGTATGAFIGGTGGGILGELMERTVSGRVFQQGVMENIEETLAVARRNVMAEALGGAVGPAAQRLASKFYTPIARKVTAEGREALEFFRHFFPDRDVGPNAAQATESRLLDFLSNISETGIFGGHVQRLLGRSILATSELANRQARVFAELVPPHELGVVMLDVLGVKRGTKLGAKRIPSAFDAAKLPAIALRREVLERAAENNVQIPAEALQKEISHRLPLVKLAAADYGDDTIAKYLSALPDAPDKAGQAALDFDTALDLRSRLLDVMRKLTKQGKGETPGFRAVAELQQTIRKEIDGALAKVDPGLVEKLAESDRIFREASDRFRTPFLRALISRANPKQGGAPESLFQAVASSGRPLTNIRELKAAVGDTDAWKMFQAYAYSDIISSASTKAGRQVPLQGEKLLDLVLGRGPTQSKSIGKEALVELFGPDGYRDLIKLGNVLKTLQAKQSQGTGRMWVQFAQAGALGGLAAGAGGLLSGNIESAALTGVAGSAGAVLLGPQMAGKLLTMPQTRKALLRGASLPLTNHAGRTIVARLTALMQAVEDAEDRFLERDEALPARVRPRQRRRNR